MRGATKEFEMPYEMNTITKPVLTSNTAKKALALGVALPALMGAVPLLTPAAAAQSICVTLPGGLIDCTPAPPAPAPPPPPGSGTVDVVASPDPLTVTLADGFVSDGPVNLGTIGGADITLVSDGVTTIANTGPGLVADSSGGITAQVTNVTTVGDDATAVTLNAVDDVIFTSDGTISTVGANSDGVNARGDSVTLNLNQVDTTGPNSQGVETFAINGPTVVNADLITTSGDGSTGAILTGTGDNTLNGRAIRTGGTDAAAFDISNDAAACVVLGAGGCDNTVTLEEVTTDGFGSTGGIVSAVGDTNVDIGVLRTGGDEAAGLNLSADPTACVVLGAGACDTAFTVGELTTAGDRSPGAIVRGAGDIDADVGVLRTEGDEAIGLDLASDPTACAVLGAGACDTSFSVGELTTSGDGATGALIRASGDTTGSVGVLSTQGDNAAGIDIASDPTACAILGAGACDVNLAADSVSTNGDGAAAVLIDSAGNVVTDLGLITTNGDNSTGLGITQDPTICAAFGPGSCGVNASADSVATNGANSNAIDIDAVDDPVVVDAGAVTTTGADSNGIDVTTINGDIDIPAGPVTVTGAGSDAIVAASVCGDISITARDDIVSADGTAILATTGCSVTVTTMPGATVASNDAGIDVTSGTGATITIGDAITSAAGPAINVDGAAADVTIAATGNVAGRIDLTDNDDTLTNNGVFAPTGTSDFGAGVDVLTNTGTIAVDGTPTLAGLETLNNSGLVDFVDGVADDILTVSGDFEGSAGSQLAIDVGLDDGALTSDQLVIGGNASGTTGIALNPVDGFAVLNPTGTVVVNAGSADAGAFALTGQTRAGFVDFSLAQSDGIFTLLARPNVLAIEPVQFSGLGLDFWYQSADAWSASIAGQRNRAGADSDRSFSFWAQGYGSTEERGGERTIDVFGNAADYDLGYDTDRRGAQGGIDYQPGSGALAIGITGGYEHARSDFASGTRFDTGGYNIGAYLLYGEQRGLYGELIAKADYFDLRAANGSAYVTDDIDGKSYGAEGEIGYRGGLGSFAFDVGAGLAYVRTELDPIEANGFRFDFERAESLRGRLGLRLSGTGTVAPYVDAKVLHEFQDGNRTSVNSGGFTYSLADDRKGTWVRGEVGLGGYNGLLALWGETGDVEGYGVRLGFRF